MGGRYCTHRAPTAFDSGAEGLSEINAVGEQFDPELHHAVVREETTEQSDNTIIAEMQKGYKLHDRLLRPSTVRVAAVPSDKKKEEPE